MMWRLYRIKVTNSRRGYEKYGFDFRCITEYLDEHEAFVQIPCGAALRNNPNLLPELTFDKRKAM